MRKLSIHVSLMLILPVVLLPGFAAAELWQVDAGISLNLPDKWETRHADFAAVNATVQRIFDCVDADSKQLQVVGWKTASDGELIAAFCVSYQKSGIGKLRHLLKVSKGAEREAIAARFLDSFAGKFTSEYAKRRMAISGLYTDLIEAGDGFALIMDGKIVDGKVTRRNASTMYMQKDALLRISFIYNESIPASLVNQLDAIPLSVEWK